MKVIIAGSRHFHDYEYLKKICDRILDHITDIEIISGCAKGADTLGEQYAKEKGYPVHRFPPDWDKYGKGAGPIRNKQMAEVGNLLIAFLAPGSRGTQSMINIAKSMGLSIQVVPILTKCNKPESRLLKYL